MSLKIVRWNLILFAALGVVHLVCAPALADADEREQNRQLLEKWQADPERLARLQQELTAFRALPPARQEHLRRLDRALREEDSATSARLQRVLERYADWLGRLPDAERKQIEEAATAEERLRIIKAVRERQWLEQLPRATREELDRLPAAQRPARIAALHQQERAFREEWHTAARHWDELVQRRAPALWQELMPQVKAFATESLFPMLSPEEKERLLRSRGQWPAFPETLVELADKHPIRLPGPTTGPSRFDELPPGVQARLPDLRDAPPPFVRLAEGIWPDYAQTVTVYARNNKIRLPRQLGPCRPEEFSQAVREFRETKLLPVLTEEEKRRLTRAEGLWPQYPRVLREAARRHGLEVPGMRLPGPRAFWDRFRKEPTAAGDGLPEVPDQALLGFVRGLDEADREQLPGLSLNDPETRARLRALYFEKNPGELQRLRQLDRRKEQRKARQKTP
jgi:hypothetical protein